MDKAGKQMRKRLHFGLVARPTKRYEPQSHLYENLVVACAPAKFMPYSNIASGNIKK